MDRFKFRVFNRNDKQCKFAILGDFITSFAKDSNPIIQQCLGVKDKNNRLIYEGDLVLFEGYLAEVVWFPYSCCFDIIFQSDKPTDYELFWNEVTVVASLVPDYILNLEGEVIGNLTTLEDLQILLGIN